MSKIKRLFWDIETSPCIGFFWGPGYKINIDHKNIINERKIICIGYKWEGESKRTVLRWDENQDDKAMLKEFLEVANQADELVAHYGNHFDMPWFRTRCLIHGFPPIPIYKTIDTKALASKYFYFCSNSMDYIASALGHGHKIDTDFDLWIKIVLFKDKAALDYMCKYCGKDVALLEMVYHDLAGYVHPKTHAGVFAGGEKWMCPNCGSDKVSHDKKRVTANGTEQHQFRCSKCHAYYTVGSVAFLAYGAAKSPAQKEHPCVPENRKRPLFIPLYSKWFYQFKSGGKSAEYRTYGPRWNEKTCFVGRAVVLSKGYGKAERLTGVVNKFEHIGGDAVIHITVDRT